MVKAKLFDAKNLLISASFILVAATAFALFPSYADAQRRGQSQEQEEEEGANRQLSSRAGEQINKALEANEIEDWSTAIGILTNLLNTELSPYEQLIAYQVRGNSYYQIDNLPAAISDFQAALRTGAAVKDERIAFRTYLGQLNFALEKYDQGIREFETAIREGAELNARLAKMLASAYVEASDSVTGSQALSYIQRGLPYAETFYRDPAPKSESDYNLVQHYYRELNRPQDELRVIRDSLQVYPGSRRSWSNLVSTYAKLGREEDAYEANKMMYLNGLFEKEGELFRLAQYYSYYENPYRGATILEREINAGRVPTNQRHLGSLANMWRQAAEFDRAIPVLVRLSDLIGDGETALKLAEAYYQENQLPQAETALELALERGGLDETGKAWELLGNVRFDQDKLQQAIQSFNQAKRYPSSRRAANNWINFINAKIQGTINRARQREQVKIDECRLTIDAERRSLVLVGTVDNDGRVVFPDGVIPQDCLYYFDGQTGDQIRKAGMSDAEFQAAEAERAAAREQQAAIAG